MANCICYQLPTGLILQMLEDVGQELEDVAWGAEAFPEERDPNFSAFFLSDLLRKYKQNDEDFSSIDYLSVLGYGIYPDEVDVIEVDECGRQHILESCISSAILDQVKRDDCEEGFGSEFCAEEPKPAVLVINVEGFGDDDDVLRSNLGPVMLSGYGIAPDELDYVVDCE
ncbi:hypothetical protein O6H91_11G009900 [Diphasiastrum complanatum]|uniref:Uncharacterized protein n=1 Tax=Diphasiastrum complanatum TaxID=34168 RepID=A0ACC2C6A9_DIPCM|nr:hypothetical protein O6H91_11G009900 [Diphasiastrum complanatum]